MLISKFWQNLTKKATTIGLEPLNKVSLVVLILIDIFVLWNVFAGLNSVQNLVWTSEQIHPCYQSWQNYQNSSDLQKKYQLIKSFSKQKDPFENQRSEISNSNFDSNKLFGQVSPLCQKFQTLGAKITNDISLESLNREIESLESSINQLRSENNRLQQEYDSTLLEKIAGQDVQNSINLSTAEKTKQNLDSNNNQIRQQTQRLASLTQEMVQNPRAQELLALVDDSNAWSQLKQSYQHSQFWQPVQVFGLQLLFLLPLIILALILHALANRRNWALLATLSWHLFLIFCIPAILRLFEFIQFGTLASWILEVIFSSLAFLGNYLLILLIPVLGYLLILFFQKVIFNKKSQFKQRLARQECWQCSFKLNKNELYCPSCGSGQYTQCSNCGLAKYTQASFCQHCGNQTIEPLISKS